MTVGSFHSTCNLTMIASEELFHFLNKVEEEEVVMVHG